MEIAAIGFRDDTGVARRGELVRFGVPVANGLAHPDSAYTLISTPENRHLQCQVRPLSYWPDGSLRWVQLSTMIDVEPGGELTLHLHADDATTDKDAPTPKLEVKERQGSIFVDAGAVRARIPKDRLQWSVEQGITPDLVDAQHRIVLGDGEGQECHAVLDGHWAVEQCGEFCVDVSVEGGWFTDNGALLARFVCTLGFFSNSKSVSVDTCIHNPKRARHSGGLWDLGDPGSIRFRSLDILVDQPGVHQGRVRPETLDHSSGVIANDDIRLFQDSSGGERWNSRNHIDRDGNRTVRFRGYKIDVSGEYRSSGARATPVASLCGQFGSVHASVKRFWQNFPKALSVNGNQLCVGLFPVGPEQPYELQGGERKTLTTYFNYGDDPEALAWTQAPLVPVIDSQHFEKARAFPSFRSDKEADLLDRIIQQALDGPRNFFEKREAIDEYGWRNFGDVFADHETHYQSPSEAPLISHYNNQYDPIYGFARQFALTGDRRWFELMDDLARHVTDIDIYHTSEDRAEYNNGLFWHTDHYLEAHTATHRTFTRHNDTSSTPGQTGGGPGAEHCYTTGLLYHYFFTGSRDSHDAVLELAHWMTAAQEGQGGLLEQLLAIKKNELPKFKAMLRGERPLAHRYPFTRGTGNYLNTLLDAWMINPEGGWLTQAEAVIRDTIHPDEDIDKRDLLNVETGWSYLILLASLVRYLSLKEELGEKDAPYVYARCSFLRYAEWMRHYEQPFLTNPDQLEFANDTWVAQDIRKAMLMFQAASLGHPEAEAFRAKGQEWLDYVCNRLSNSEEAHYSRILIILLQNYGPQHLEPKPLVQTSTSPECGVAASAFPAPSLTWRSLVVRMVQRLLRGIGTFSPRREKAWLSARLDRA